MPRWLCSPCVERLALLALCAAYIQGGLAKSFDFSGAIAEQTHFGVPLPGVAATATIVTELAVPSWSSPDGCNGSALSGWRGSR